MKRLESISTIIFQYFLTFIILFCIYMVFAVLDNDEADLISEVGLFTVHPMFAIIFSAITVIGCTIVGLPIRLVTKFNAWWVDRPILPIIGTTIGIVMLLLSLTSSFSETKKVIINQEETTKEIPNIVLALTGWFLTAFSLLHFYPMTIFRFIRNKFTKHTKPLI